MSFSLNFKGEQQISIEKGQSILKAALAAGIPHYHACGGRGQCTTCRVLVLKGEEKLTPPTSNEQAIKKVNKFPDNIRLACQTCVLEEGVEIQRLIRDEIDRFIFVDDYAADTVGEIGELRKLALFFIDVRSFTPFLEANLPFDVIHLMRRILGIFKNCIVQYKGEIIDTAGDGLYAVFGLDSTIREATESAVLAGFKILEDLKIYNNTYVRPYFNHTFEVGIGVHVGNVVVGNVGIGLSHNLTVMGYPVNIAARLQAATKELNNNFVISALAYRLLKNPPYSLDCGYLNLTGVSNAYEVKLIGQPYQSISASPTGKLLNGPPNPPLEQISRHSGDMIKGKN
ncbi:adenylate/guanylate cyclase domain-containing protein [Adhaeribacter sp. BT258]|uniref:Adenylate/guanylate cyclase domain-containing protein n=1 Tax=Adhaeribacter terrigena TaxID=2793070 RepID=A0ABS1BZX8_9BACT|nr:adenylate/guanylate cyclase domain-containing protein [Adhaeribacter terrigena]MBK0402692.1 adenylate/guanylate cyclase domain-containing protein [Adhaeribacter terrigena]